MKKTKSKGFYIFLYIAIPILVLGTLYGVFHKDIKEFGDGLERLDQRKQNYKKDHPNASKSDMDKAFRKGINSLEKWEQDYKNDHPNATKSDIEDAWENAWKQ